jgi:glycosyltransferase involved in cell wall biosynthesis
VLGHVPDLTSHLAGARATIAPLRWGAGFKGKVATSIAHGVPAVVTPVAAEGMDLEHGAQVLIAADPRSLAEGLLTLLEDDDLWMKMSDACMGFARGRWSGQAAQTGLIGLMSRLAAPPTIEISDQVRALALSSLVEASHA